MDTILTSVFGIAGGLALFLYGMNGMSEALQKAAGERMKVVLAFLTRNRVMGALAGALVTAVLQSSSATTVMTIGFVSAGLMTLPQAISVIFGANIGTTMTAQLIAFNISDYIFPIIFIGFLIQFIAKKENVKNVGLVIFNFGLLFEGIEIMSSVMKPVASSAFFTDLMGKVSNVPILGILLGMCMTLIVQSSSATIAILQSFASQAAADGVSSIIGLTGAIPILLGDNIGTTVTALLASIGQSKDAKRTAVAHSVFNITGTILFSMFIPQFAAFVRMISPKGNEVDVISRQIANAHTTFNVVCTLIWIPLLPVMVKIVKWIIPDRKKQVQQAAAGSVLDRRVISQPAAALYLVSGEVRRALNTTADLLSGMGSILLGREKDPSSYRSALDAEKTSCRDVIDYIGAMFSVGSLTKEQTEEASGFLVIINNCDRICDRCREIVGHAAEMEKSGFSFSKEAGEELESCLHTVQNIYSNTRSLLTDRVTMEGASRISKAKGKLRKNIKNIQKAHLARVKEKKCSPALTPVFTDILYNMDRISDNCVTISEEALAGTKLAVMEVPDKENREAAIEAEKK